MRDTHLSIVAAPSSDEFDTSDWLGGRASAIGEIIVNVTQETRIGRKKRKKLVFSYSLLFFFPFL